MSSLPHVLAHVCRSAWAIELGYGRALQSVLIRRLSGVRLSREDIDFMIASDKAARAERLAAAERRTAATGGAVAVIPFIGTMVAREWESADASGGGLISMEGFAKRFRAAEQDPRVSTILLDIDSPGGDVSGVQEAADLVFNSSKPVVAHANTLAASGAYWIATQANELVVTPSGQVGSVGVYTMHQDLSAALEQEGVAVTLVSAGKHKVEANPFGPLDDEAREQLQSVVDTAYQQFVGAVARGRGVSPAAVRSGFGEGRVLDAQAARKAGMVDRIETLDQTVARLASGGKVKRRAKAETDVATLRAEAAADRAEAAELHELAADLRAEIVETDAIADPAPKQGASLPDDTRARIDALRDMDD